MPLLSSSKNKKGNGNVCNTLVLSINRDYKWSTKSSTKFCFPPFICILGDCSYIGEGFSQDRQNIDFAIHRSESSNDNPYAVLWHLPEEALGFLKVLQEPSATKGIFASTVLVTLIWRPRSDAYYWSKIYVSVKFNSFLAFNCGSSFFDVTMILPRIFGSILSYIFYLLIFRLLHWYFAVFQL